MLAPTCVPASKTIGSIPRASRCAAAASPTGPAPMTATRSGFVWFMGQRSLTMVIEEFRCDAPTVHNFFKDIKKFRYDSPMAAPLPVIQCCAPLGSERLSEDEVLELERVFKALADRHRVKILNRLLSADGEAVCVCDFEDLLGLKQSTVSYHLKQLLDAGIVDREKRGSSPISAFAPRPSSTQRPARATLARLPNRPPLQRASTSRSGASVIAPRASSSIRQQRPISVRNMRRPRWTRDFMPDVERPSCAAACSCVSSPGRSARSRCGSRPAHGPAVASNTRPARCRHGRRPPGGRRDARGRFRADGLWPVPVRR